MENDPPPTAGRARECIEREGERGSVLRGMVRGRVRRRAREGWVRESIG